jgi:hypothetical protein
MFKGIDCGLLDLLPASRSEGLKLAYTSTWGGSIIAEDSGSSSGDDVVYHMYASLIGGHCGLDTWKGNSQVVHATSVGSVTGPYTLVEDQDGNEIVLSSFAHNPSIRFDSLASSSSSKEDGYSYTLQHIGCGYANAEAPFVEGCTNGSTPAAAVAATAAAAAASTAHNNKARGRGNSDDPLCNQFNVSVRTSSSLSGPWALAGQVDVVNPTGSDPW